MPLAQLNIARMRFPLEAPEMAGFVSRLAEVNAAAEAAPGFVWRLKDEDGPGATSYRILDDDRLIVNLSVWTDIESLRAFVIGQAGHRDVLQARYDWFERATEPMTVCWEVSDGHEPSLQEAEDRLVQLRRGGPSAEVRPFTYRGDRS